MAVTLDLVYDLKANAAAQLSVDQIISLIINGNNSLLGMYDSTKTYKNRDMCFYMDDSGILHVLTCIADTTTSDPINLAAWKEYSVIEQLDKLGHDYILITATEPTSNLNNIWIQQAYTDINGVVHGVYSYNKNYGKISNSYAQVYPTTAIDDVKINTFTSITDLDNIPTVGAATSLRDLVQDYDASIRKLTRDKYDASNVTSTATANKVLTLDSNAILPATAEKARADVNGEAITSYIKNVVINGSTITFTFGDSTTKDIHVSIENNAVTNTLSPTTKAYVTGTTSDVTTTGTQVFDTGVYLGTTAGSLYADNFYGKLTGNVTGNSDTATNATNDKNGLEIDTTYAPLASPALTGTPTAPTATAGTSTTQLATTAFVSTSYMSLAGGTMTGALTLSGAPTTDLHAATKAYVDTAISGVSESASAAKALFDNTTKHTIVVTYEDNTTETINILGVNS